MIGKRFGQPAITSERSSPVAIFLPIGDKGGIVLKSVKGSLENRIPVLKDLVLGNWFSVHDTSPRFLRQSLGSRIFRSRKDQFGFSLGIIAFPLSFGEHKIADFFRVQTWRNLQVGGQSKSLGHRLGHVRLVLVNRILGQQSGFDQLLGIGHERINCLPGIDLFLQPVGRSIGWGVSGIAIGNGLEKNGSFTFLNESLLALDRVHHRQGVIAIHPFGMHGLWVHACPHSGQTIESHGLARRLASHPIKVIHEVEDDGQPSAHRGIPKLLELAHRRKIHRFPCRAASH